MSIIVAVKKGNELVIAADSANMQGSIKQSSKYIKNYEKIIKLGDSYVGTSNYFSDNDVLKSCYNNNKNLFNFDTRFNIFETLLEIHPILKDEYYIETSEDTEDQAYESNQIHGIVVNKNGIFEIQSFREVIEYNYFCAIGAGKELALGAMYATYDIHNATEVAEIAIKAACEFEESCELPVEMYIIEKK